MRTLFVVGPTVDGTGLVLCDRRDGTGETFVVRTDHPALRRLAAPPPTRARPLAVAPTVSRLTPREIQAELRAGRSVAEVAAAAGVGEAHIERWEPPVAQEQDAAIRRAQRATLDAGRRGPSSLPLASAVEANLRARGGEPPADGAGWTAYLAADGWVVRFRSEPGGSSRRQAGDAEWTFGGPDGAVVVRNRAAAALGWVGPDGPRPRRVRSNRGSSDQAARRPRAATGNPAVAETPAPAEYSAPADPEPHELAGATPAPVQGALPMPDPGPTS